MSLVIAIKDLSKSYIVGEEPVHALRSVSLDIGRGEFVAVVGPSGSGKSTLMHILGCLDRPTSGSYRLDGQDVSRFTDDEISHVRNKKIGFVFQGFNLLSRTSALENVELPLLYDTETHRTAAERRGAALEALQTVGLRGREKHHSNQLSGGQQQRVAIARALMTRPSILLADEPTGNLDSQTSVEVMELIQRLNRERNLTIVLITHEHDVAAYGSRIISFKDGRISSDELNAKRPGAAQHAVASSVEG